MKYLALQFALVATLVCSQSVKAGFTAHLESTVGPGVTSPVYAVQINWTQKQAGGVDVPWLAHNFSSFCIEYNSHVYLGRDYTFQVRTLESSPIPGTGMGSAKSDAIRRLWAGYRTAINTASSPTATNALDGKYTVREQYAAFQLAIWKILGTSNLPTNFAGDINNLSNIYVTYANNKSNHNLANLVALSSGLDSKGKPNSDFQDQIVELKDGWVVNGFGDIVKTPAPATVVLMISGCFPLLALGRFRKMVQKNA